jgi:hypothetical protein
MANKSYSEKLRDPRWQKKRLEILQRDNFKCRICNDTESELQVHHLSYANDPWEIDNWYLVTLCKDCHAHESKYGNQAFAALKVHLFNAKVHSFNCYLSALVPNENLSPDEVFKNTKPHIKNLSSVLYYLFSDKELQELCDKWIRNKLGI